MTTVRGVTSALAPVLELDSFSLEVERDLEVVLSESDGGEKEQDNTEKRGRGKAAKKQAKRKK